MLLITEVRIKLMPENNERLQAFASVVFEDSFVVHDLKIIESSQGLFIAMPSRKLTDRCPSCSHKNCLRAKHCNECGYKLRKNRAVHDDGGRAQLFADIAHPIDSVCRTMIKNTVLEAYNRERELAKKTDYVCKYDSFEAQIRSFAV